MASTGPKFNQKQSKNLSPTKLSKASELNSSDSFSHSQSYKTNNTPDHFKSKIQAKGSKKSEFTTSVQEFLKQSTEIQDEIRKLSEICQQISPKFQDSKMLEIPEKLDWEKANEVLASLGYSQFDLQNEEVPYDLLAETFFQLLNDFSNQKGILAQNKEALLRQEKEIEALILERNKEKKHSGRTNFEQEIQELEKMTRDMEVRFKKMKEKLKEKEIIIKGLRGNVQVHEEFLSVDKMKKVFEGFLYREFREKSKTDNRILALIEHYESKGPGQLQVILDELEVYSGTEALASIARMKQQAFVYQETEKVMQELFYQLFNKPISGSFCVKFEEVYENILGKVNDLINTVKYLEEFKTNIFLALGAKKNAGHSEILEKIQSVNKIRKLFQIENDSSETESIENLFLFVHEMKMFLKKLRESLGKDLGVAELLEEVLTRIE